jgi:hypothetical protein
MKLIRQSRVVRKNQLLSAFVERQAEYKEAKTAYESAYAKLKDEATRVLKLYVPLKHAVSDRNWSGKYITDIKIANGGKTVELTLEYNIENSVMSYWKFPSWMIGADTDRIVEGLTQIIEDDRQRFAKKEQERQAQVRANELAQLEELKQKYNEVSNVVS